MQKPTKTGYLYKKGIINKKWQKRWFSLGTDSKLNYHKTHNDKNFRSIPLEQSIVNVCTDYNSIQSEFGFVIITPQRIFYLYAESKAEMDDWLRKLTVYSILENENSLMEQAEESIRESMTRRSNLEDELLRKKDTIFQHLTRPVYHPLTPMPSNTTSLSSSSSSAVVSSNNNASSTASTSTASTPSTSTPTLNRKSMSFIHDSSSGTSKSAFTAAHPTIKKTSQPSSSLSSSYHRYSSSFTETTLKPSSFSSFSSERGNNSNNNSSSNNSNNSTEQGNDKHTNNLKLFEQMNNSRYNININNSDNNNNSSSSNSSNSNQYILSINNGDIDNSNNSNSNNDFNTKRARSLSFSFKKKTVIPS